MEDLSAFWQIVIDIWRQGVGGVNFTRIFGALAIFMGFLIFRGLFARFALGGLRLAAKRTPWTADDKLVDLLAPPLRFIPIVVGIFFATQYLHLEGIYADVTLNVVRSLVAITIFWATLRILRPIDLAFDRLELLFTRELVEWMVKALRLAIICVGAATVLQIWGIQVAPIIAGAGLLGVAVALGAQDLFKNLIAGLLILGEKRFGKGDWILVPNVVEGTVESIGFRSTMIRRFDKAPVMVPNAQLSDTAVVNFSQMTYRRIKWSIGVEYRTSVPQLHKIRDEIFAYIVENDAFASPSEVSTFVHIEQFGSSSIDLMLYCFTRTTVWAEYLKAREALAYKIMDIVEGAGAGFAFPSQSLYVESLPVGEPVEIFVPPRAPQGGAKQD
ncbi:MAG: mechanosensitive ion channel family protein [Proteobacteria bacterium]|nr:mechanosensitive ion channel family protein [Pseudomonadota bacterium]